MFNHQLNRIFHLIFVNYFLTVTLLHDLRLAIFLRLEMLKLEMRDVFWERLHYTDIDKIMTTVKTKK